VFRARIATLAIVVGAVLGLGGSPAFGSVRLGWSAPALIDSHQPFGSGTGVGIEGVSCPGADLCVALDQNGNALASTDPTSSSPTYVKTPVASSGTTVNPIDCPTTSFCVVIAGHDVYSSQDPRAGVWSAAQVVDAAGALNAISCDPTASLCVAVDGSGNAFTTIDPTSASPTWTSAPIDTRAINGVSCPSTSLCVAVDSSGYGITSTNPGAESPTWTSQLIGPTGSIFGVSCAPGTSTCVAIEGGDPNVLTTTTPAGSWNSATVDTGKEDASVSCGSATLCVLGSFGDGPVLLTNDPGSSSPMWSGEIRLTPMESTVEVGCAATFCVAVDNDGELYSDGDVFTSNQNPTVASPSWTSSRQDGYDALTSVSCPTTSLCVAGDNAGDVLTTTDPTAATPSWTVDRADPGIVIMAVSCDPSASLCVAVDNYGQAVTSTDPTAANPTWSPPIQITPSSDLIGLSCPSASMCVAVDRLGDVLISTDPTGHSYWTAQDVLPYPGPPNPPPRFVGLSCPSAGFCMAGWDTSKGQWGASSSTDPTDFSSWVTSQGPGTAYLFSVSCASSALCVASAADASGVVSSEQNGVLATADPDSTQPTWALTTAPVGPVDCPTAALCIALDGGGIGPTATANGADLLSGSAAAWTEESDSLNVDGAPDPNAPSAAVSCPTATFCVSVDGAGYAMAGTVSPSLSVTLTGTGSGQVTGSGMSCAGSCSEFYQQGTVVTLTASPAPGSVFAGWSGGGCAGTAPCQVTMSADQDVSARFDTASSVHVSITGQGSVTGPGIDCPSTCVGYEAAGSITLTATPASGYKFAGWSGSGCRGVGPCKLNVSGETQIMAEFELLPPVCKLYARDADVRLASRKRHGTTTKVGTIRVVESCNQAGKLTISGAVIEQPSRQGLASRTFTVGARHLALARAGTVVATLQLPPAAVEALLRRAHESVALTLQETNANGVGDATAKISRLHVATEAKPAPGGTQTRARRERLR